MGVADRFLVDVANRKRLGADLTGAVLGVERSGDLETASAFPSLAVTLDDPRDRILHSEVFTRPAVRELGTAVAFALRPVDVLLDGVWYRLRKAERSGDTVTLTWNHRGVVYMAQHDTPMSASRNDETRAQFIRRQVLEAGRARGAGHRLAFWAYELRRRMPLAAPEADTSSRSESSRDVADTTESAKSAKGLTVKGVPMNAAQRSRVARIVKVQDELKAPTKARVAQFCAAIGESAIGEDTGSRGTTFQTTVIPESDLEGQARAFLKGGRSFKAGGAIALAKQAGLTPGDIASAVEVSDKPGPFYNKHKREAEAIVGGMGDGGDGGSSEPSSYTKPYRYRRPRGTDGWKNTGDLADEVHKRRFVTIPQRGSDLFAYAADVDLLKLRAQARIDLDASYVLDPEEWDLDYGKTVRAMSLTVAGDPFDADFAWGLPVIVEGGPGGKWIVWSVHEVDGTPGVELELRQPEGSQPEPRPETVTRADPSDSAAGADADTATGKFVARGKSIGEHNYPYVWGGGHAHVGTPDGGTGRDPGTGYDCSGYIGACAYSAGMWPDSWGTSVPGSGTFASSWGEPGEGERLTVWAHGGHVFAEVKIPGERVKYVDTSRQAGGDSGPHVRYGKRSTAGFTPRHWSGT